MRKFWFAQFWIACSLAVLLLIGCGDEKGPVYDPGRQPTFLSGAVWKCEAIQQNYLAMWKCDVTFPQKDSPIVWEERKAEMTPQGWCLDPACYSAKEKK